MNYRELMSFAYKIASESPDPSTQTGAVILSDKTTVWAHNGIHKRWPQNYDDREYKLNWVTHAESGAVYQAAVCGLRCNNATMICPWAACNRCAISIVESGIRTLVLHKKRMEVPSSWDSQIQDSLAYMKRAGVIVLYFDDDLPEAPQIKIGGELWQP